jgi:predicted ArsR family transcriptional regulator
LTVPEEPLTTYRIEDPAQLKAISDPFRRELLSRFSKEPRTTKQVAEEMGIKSNKLYHHVEMLERLGLVRLVETRPKRGTTERYLQAVAPRFSIHPSAYGEGQGEGTRVIREAFEGSVVAAIESCEGKGPTEVMLVDTRLTLDAESRAELETRLAALLAEYRDCPRPDGRPHTFFGVLARRR